MSFFQKSLQILLVLAGIVFTNISFSQDATATLKQHHRVYLFLSESCPICQQMVPELKKVIAKYPDFTYLFVFPNYTVSNSASVNYFMHKYKLIGESKIDSNQLLTVRYQITHTPEIIITDSDDSVLYKGKLDNQYEKLGRQRKVITEHYLDDALNALSSGQEINIKYTEPIGCYVIKP